MKRFCAFLGVACIMLSFVALRLRFCRLNVFLDGTYSTFSDNDTQISLSISKGYERVDLRKHDGSEQEVLKKLKAKTVKKENVGDILIIYAYSPCLLKGVRLFGSTVNVMIAVTESAVVVGSPLIKGSF